MSDTQICRKLVMEVHWKAADERPPHGIPGIYTIGRKKRCGEIVIIYAGRSNDIARRLNEHFQPSRVEEQAINKYLSGLQSHTNIQVKWVRDVHQANRERKYLQCLQDVQGLSTLPEYNIQQGDGP